ncbi:hydrolase, NUDIX family protein [Cardiosporidium cionae]|uniref:Hydrolase, NUDIX family protein n=1 Tax=Cardiosporidium cionae TaxID=476202 RepID=A0ABQ7J9X2_9APIC|nr:hydrolase, NUDIX family protein [Cardiosporidium cionae]|eukprot:KAF8820808.1 hydrolase, NUDIX family protein [Cardiosporidium cionae]
MAKSMIKDKHLLHTSKRFLPRVTEIVEVARAPWLSLQQVHYKDFTGKSCVWDRFYRNTRNPNMEVDSAAIFAETSSATPGHKPEIILVKQYRAALDKYTIELPAGLIDPGETIEETAIRELQEETGYTGKVKSCSPALAQSTLGCENLQLVHVEIDLDNQDMKNMQQHEDDKNIEVLKVPMQSLLQFLKDQGNEVCLIFDDLYCLAFGLEIADSVRKGLS